MLGWSTDVPSLMAVGELVLFKEAVNVQLCELEGSLIHALLLEIIDIC